MPRHRSSLRSLLTAIAIAGGATAVPAATPDPVVARPGSVVRWPGEGIIECEQGGERFAPAADACLFAIDLEAKGTLAVARRTPAGRETRALRVGDYPWPTESLTGVDDKYVSPGKEALARIERDKKESGAAFRLRSAHQDGLPFSAPLAKLPEGGRFGARRIFNGEARSPHGGTDFRAATGTEVFAPAAGVVAISADHYFAGQSVYVDHGDGLISMAFHLSSRAVKKGDRVARGQLLGKVGASGRVTGPHLHFAVRLRGARVDPMPLLEPVESLPRIP
jgi:murein DD-endopeptidase MepM/ murein hydrolase activator NlpD